MLANGSDIVVELVKAGANLDLQDEVCLNLSSSLNSLLFMCCTESPENH